MTEKHIHEFGTNGNGKHEEFLVPAADPEWGIAIGPNSVGLNICQLTRKQILGDHLYIFRESLGDDDQG